MQRRQSHVDDAKLSLATAQASKAAVAEEVAGATVQSDGTELRSKAHRLHAHELTARAGRHVLGRRSQVPWPHPNGLGELPHPSPGGPHSVGSKGGFFQAKIGPVDGQSLSGLSGRIQAESFEIFHFPLRLIHIHTV